MCTSTDSTSNHPCPSDVPFPIAAAAADPETPPDTPINDGADHDEQPATVRRRRSSSSTRHAPPPSEQHISVRSRMLARLNLPGLDAAVRKAAYGDHHHHHALNWLPYFIIFTSGVGCSLVLVLLLNATLSVGPHHRTTAPSLHRRHHQPFHSLPAGLQVRDEFPVIAPGAADDSEGRRSAGDGRASRKHSTTSEAADQQEALSSLRVALDMRAAGKDDKALRLFKHALALAPRNPDVLTNYGEYLEHSRRNVLHADLLYTQALSVKPDHQIALANRRRTASIVATLDADRLAELDAKRDAISAIHESNAALRRAKKEAYFQNIYHSVGIEGNTMTLAQTRSVLETRMAVHGKSIDEHNEILGLDAAMKYINATLVNQNGYITMQDILEVHRRVLGHVDPVEGGELRRTQVYVGGHVPPGPGDLSVLMLRFEQWLNSAQAVAMHPVRLAALAHYKLVHIHPFIDGNGRTSRLLMNTILMRSGYPPVIIPKQQRHQYYDFLQLANEGDTRPFVRFVADCTEKTLDLFLWATSELSHQVPLLAQTEDVLAVLAADDGGGGSGDDDGVARVMGDGAQQSWQWDERF